MPIKMLNPTCIYVCHKNNKLHVIIKDVLVMRLLQLKYNRVKDAKMLSFFISESELKFVAPEIFQNSGAYKPDSDREDKSTNDIYSLGRILYFLVVQSS
jgi:hypothetical protein